MIRTRRMAVMTLAMVSVAVVDACRHKPPEVQPTVTVSSRDTAAERRQREADARRRQDSIDAANAARARARADSIAAARAAADRANAGMADVRNALTAVVHFDYDQADLRPDAKAALDAKVPILQANANVRIRIAGHTDERGSDEYNLALGQRRAAVAKRYLVEHGINESRIETISYGEERPVAQGSDETAWSQNRRDEFEITAGGQMLRKP